ncbi:MAG TPA: glycogen-binding domain-containing protein, partial [Longimicrobiaceae bacterium]|nr:glycogen-binding domain-containing protein [Longimicrobiaceae bacterium]
RIGRERKGVWLGVEAGGEFFRYSETTYTEEDGVLTQTEPAGGGVTLEAAPTLEIQRDRWGLELSSALVQSWTRISNLDNSLIALDGAAVLTAAPTPRVEIGVIGRYLLLPEGGYPHLGVSVQLSRRVGSVWAFGGRWLTELMESPRTGYGVGGRVSLGEETGFLASWQQEPSDPIYASTPRRTWSVQVSRTLGRRPAPVPPVSVPPPADGLVAIRLPVSAAEAAPFVLGDFTEWKPVAMTRAGEFWEVRLPIPSGVYRYGFRSADGSWFLPDSVPRADDGMGGESAVLVVP